MVDDLEMADDWDEYSEKIMKNLKENLTPQEFNQFISDAKIIYDKMTK